MTSSEQLEREAEQTRTHIADTLDELRARMTPGHVVDQLLDYAHDSSGGMFVGNLRRQVVNNPLPVALMGAGIAWLAMAGGRSGANGRATPKNRMSRTRPVAGDDTGSAGDTRKGMREAAYSGFAAAADKTSSTGKAVGSAYNEATARAGAMTENLGENLRDTARSAAGSVKDTASAAYDSVAETTSAAYGMAADRMGRAESTLRESASSLQGNLSEAGGGLMQLLRDQPLVMLGLGLTVGAIIGAALPSTEMEEELMGDRSDAVKREAADFVEQQIDKGKAVAEQAFQGAKEEAERQGLTPTATNANSQDGSGGEAASEHAATLVPTGDAKDATPQNS